MRGETLGERIDTRPRAQQLSQPERTRCKLRLDRFDTRRLLLRAAQCHHHVGARLQCEHDGLGMAIALLDRVHDQ